MKEKKRNECTTFKFSFSFGLLFIFQQKAFIQGVREGTRVDVVWSSTAFKPQNYLSISKANIAISCEATYHLEGKDMAKTRNPAPYLTRVRPLEVGISGNKDPARRGMQVDHLLEFQMHYES